MKKTAKTVLIIKLGYCETLANEEGFIPSLGDVFRHTALLHHYGRHRVTWLTSKSAYILLENNPYIHELLIYEGTHTQMDLLNREFDEILCLEKAPIICNLAKSIKARRHMGFGWNGRKVHAHPMAEQALDIANGKSTPLFIQDVLYKMIGTRWRGEDYILGYQSPTSITYDIGLNFLVGNKWPSKAWPDSCWKELEVLCAAECLTVSWQRGSKDLYEYMDWIHSGRLIVTCDSLGMHLSLAMKKKVVALFGPTPSDQIYMYNRGIIIKGKTNCPKAPCMQSECDYSPYCMDAIRPEIVMQSIRTLLGEKRRSESIIRKNRPITAPVSLSNVLVTCS